MKKLLAALMFFSAAPMTGLAAQAEIMLAAASDEIVSVDYHYAVLSDGTAGSGNIPGLTLFYQSPPS